MNNHGMPAHVSSMERRAPTPIKMSELTKGVPDDSLALFAEHRALEALNAKLTAEVLHLEKNKQAMKIREQEIRKDAEIWRRREQEARDQVQFARRDAERAAIDAQDAEKEARQLLQDLDDARRALQTADHRFQEQVARTNAEADRASRLEEVLRSEREARRATEETFDEDIRDLKASFHSETETLEAELRRRDDDESKAHAEIDDLRAQLTDALDRADNAQAQHRNTATALAKLKKLLHKKPVPTTAPSEEAPSPPKQQPHRSGGFGHITTTTTTTPELPSDDVQRRLKDSIDREKLAKRRSDHLAAILRNERDRLKAAEATIAQLRTNLDRATKSAKFERDRCQKQKIALQKSSSSSSKQQPHEDPAASSPGGGNNARSSSSASPPSHRRRSPSPTTHHQRQAAPRRDPPRRQRAHSTTAPSYSYDDDVIRGYIAEETPKTGRSSVVEEDPYDHREPQLDDIPLAFRSDDEESSDDDDEED